MTSDGSNDAFPFERGSHGPAVRDLQRRLTEIGWDLSEDVGDLFGPATQGAIRAFQADRGLEISGTVDGPTWRTLVEAGYRLGDRPIYHHRPMLRGDDVQDLQIRLGSLGFDAGWVDGIFGPDSEAALKDFQRNAGLTTDGIAGPATMVELQRLGAKSARTEPVAGVRERESLRRRAGVGLTDRRIVLGETGTLAALVDATGRELRTAGGRVLTLHDPDASDQARAANQFQGDVYVGLTTSIDPGSRLQYFSIEQFVSTGGQLLADEVAPRIADLLDGPAPRVSGGGIAILRETRMPAIWCELGPVSQVVRRHHDLAKAFSAALAAWCTAPLNL